MIIQEFLFAILIALIITMVLGLYRLGQLINAVEDRAKILQHRLLDMMKTPQQRAYEDKMVKKIMKVDVRNNNVEQALRILKRKTQKEGIIRIAREKEFYEKPTAKRQRKKKSSEKTLRKLRMKNELAPKRHSRRYY